jgi:hypothetical protein
MDGEYSPLSLVSITWSRPAAWYTINCRTVFWVCSAVEGSKFVSSPFDRINLGFEGLFGSRTLFYNVLIRKVLGWLIDSGRLLKYSLARRLELEVEGG